ncbi:beta-ketoacyl-ACP synthase III [Streptomyces violascens]|uniref:Beta-ketoacyl-[acyl-carrier-protein] synthase III n=1 Tax=Streptomyces violascens TaxID=67381 RepID=A0ABQ3QSL8_9ACTN|nr:beta-ketoacyl-ACP synthase III [Streptomyces violascens]GGU33202.1 3-oxoacyl-[acyl-carrier-protein] synthase 3 protein 5 [Streptomyces violascens]GHI40247.1 3-oxoacyl-[acyl-carrier-protein] synthase 3 protein 5 [Streptomyces violascens]
MRFDDSTAVITGIGSCLPDHILSNDDIIAAGALATSDDWIRTRTGIDKRRRVAPGQTTGDLATGAGSAALASAGNPRVDLVILATSTPDHPCPATAPWVAHRLGLDQVPAFDLAAVCSGFLYALATATASIRGGLCRSCLVIGADTYSTIINPHDRETAGLFGDGAGAVVLSGGAADTPGAILAADLGSDGDNHHLINIPAGGSRHPHQQPPPGPDSHYFHMRGREVYAHAVRHMTRSTQQVLTTAGWATHTKCAFIGHQANQRILDSVADRLGVPPAHRFGNIGRLGNTAAASIPLVLADPATQQVLSPGDRTVLTAFGGGLTWASIALTWPAVTPRTAPAKAHLTAAATPNLERSRR